MVQKSIRLFIDKNPKLGDIITMHFSGMPPSQIDEELLMKTGRAKKAIIEFWKFAANLEKEGIISYDKPKKRRKNGEGSGTVQNMQAGTKANRS